MLELYPTGWTVLLKPVMREKSVIVIAGSNNGQDVRAEYHVVRVGDKVTTLKEGDIVVAGHKEMVRALFRGQEVLVQDERNIWCVARENPKAKKAVDGLTVMEKVEDGPSGLYQPSA